MAESTIVKTKRDGTIILADNSGFGGANIYTVSAEPGDFAITFGGRAARNNFLDRGRLVSSVRYGDDAPLTGSFSAYWRDATDAGAATLFDVLHWTGYVASNWVGTLGVNGEVKCVDVRLSIEGSDHGDGADHSITVTDCSLDGGFAEGDPNTISVNWQSHTDVAPTLA